MQSRDLFRVMRPSFNEVSILCKAHVVLMYALQSIECYTLNEECMFNVSWVVLFLVFKIDWVFI